MINQAQEIVHVHGLKECLRKLTVSGEGRQEFMTMRKRQYKGMKER